MPGVEWLSEDDELLDTAPRRRAPRAVIAVLAVGLAAVAVIVIARHQSSTPRATPKAVVSSATPSNVVPNLAISSAYDLVGDERDDRLFALADNRLYAIAVDGQPDGPAAPVASGELPDSELELVLDEPDHLIWAVPQNATGHDGLAAGFAEPFDTRTLRAGERVPLPGLVESAAVLGGALYVTTDAGLWRTAVSGAGFELVDGPPVADALLVADPSRDRLLAVRLTAGRPIVRALRPVASRLVSGPPVRLPVSSGVLVVARGSVWLSGSRGTRSVLVRLDPATLRPRRRVLSGRADVEIQGTGARSLYVSVGDDLQCRDAGTGRLLRSFGRVRGSFASIGHHGFVGTISALHPLAMGRCPG